MLGQLSGGLQGELTLQHDAQRISLCMFADDHQWRSVKTGTPKPLMTKRISKDVLTCGTSFQPSMRHCTQHFNCALVRTVTTTLRNMPQLLLPATHTNVE